MQQAPANLATVADESASAWADRSPSEIVAFILRRYHDPLHRDLPGLVANAQRVELDTRGAHLCPEGLGAHLEQVALAVESHLAKEEKILFPLIVAGRGRAAFMPIKVMMAEHEDHAANLARTRQLTHEFQLPGDASPAWRALYLDLQRLEAVLDRHIDLENHVLFTRVMDGDLDHP
jgi:regulator of cell morphogenesis and NO signaling